MRLWTWILLGFTLLTLPALAGTLVDDFSDGDWEGWIPHNRDNAPIEWRIEDRQLVGINPHAATHAPYLQLTIGEDWRDYTVECRVLVFTETFGSAGISARAKFNGQEGYDYYVAVSPFDKKVVWGESQGETYTLNFSDAVFVEANQWYHLRITCQGDHVQMFVDEMLIVDLQSNTSSEGTVLL